MREKFLTALLALLEEQGAALDISQQGYERFVLSNGDFIYLDEVDELIELSGAAAA